MLEQLEEAHNLVTGRYGIIYAAYDQLSKLMIDILKAY